MTAHARRSATIIAILFSLLPSPVGAEDRFPSFSVYQLTNEGKKAFGALLAAAQFEEGPIGFAAVPSKLIEAYRVLLKEEKADAAFKSLLERAAPAGQLYALCGVYYTDRIFFLRVVERHKTRGDEVRVASGCNLGRRRAAKIVEADEPNVVRLARPEQSLAEWEDDNREPGKGGFVLDIVGGGYPSSFSRR